MFSGRHLHWCIDDTGSLGSSEGVGCCSRTFFLLIRRRAQTIVITRTSPPIVAPRIVPILTPLLTLVFSSFLGVSGGAVVLGIRVGRASVVYPVGGDVEAVSVKAGSSAWYAMSNVDVNFTIGSISTSQQTVPAPIVPLLIFNCSTTLPAI